MQNVQNIREKLKRKYLNDDFVDINGQQCIELIGESFVADEESIIGEPNYEYISKEIKWYLSQSLNVNDIDPPVPQIWKQVADEDGHINSNYGYLIFSKENGYQYNNVFNELKNNPSSRRAQMIYTRPSIWTDYNKNGRSDFICTDSVQYFIRGDKLIAHVRMRSNDAWAGYRNDFAWQLYVQRKLALELGLNTKNVGPIIWTVGSLHVYPRQMYILDNMCHGNGDHKITKADYDKLTTMNFLQTKIGG